MDFMTSVKTCLAEKYAEFNGRASRPEFWWFVLFCFIVNVIAGAVFRGWISSLISLALFVPSIAVGTRRLHDINKSGWLQLLAIIPIIGWAILIYWAAQPGQAGSNQYGEAPQDAPPPPPAEVAPGQQ
jgi:uncharacterized membrane protein YhaH (DUF805 family)